MLIIGAKGFARELLEDLTVINIEEIAFYDDVSENLPEQLYDRFSILRNKNEVLEYFKKFRNEYTLGLGNPFLRKKMDTYLESLGGKLVGTTSKNAVVSSYNVCFNSGTNILSGAIISNGCQFGRGCLVYYGAKVTHGCQIGDYVELSPGATLLGNVKVGNYVQIGANSTILPGIRIESNTIIGAGAVVTKDVKKNTVVAGVPAKPIKSKKK